jgi:hypothetical protein
MSDKYMPWIIQYYELLLMNMDVCLRMASSLGCQPTKAPVATDDNHTNVREKRAMGDRGGWLSRKEAIRTGLKVNTQRKFTFI